jgi:Glycosyltransferase family 87
LPDSPPPPRRALADCLLSPNCVFAVYCIAAIIATIIKLAPGPFEQNGFHYQPLQNFAIFRNAFYHLIHHQNLYAQFQFEQWDFYRYSPAFALLFAPFALLPYQIGAVLWNLLNAVALYWAVRSVPALDERAKMLALWFMFLAMLNSVANAQSNALVAAFMIAAWSAEEREKPDLSALFIVLAASIKLFGVSALLPCLLGRARKQLIGYTAAWAAVFALAPLLAVSWNELGLLYRNWYATLQTFNHARLGISFMGFLKTWLHLDPPANYVVAAGAVVLIASALLGPQSRVIVLASVLIFVTIFNYAAESPSYVIAVAGVALWYFAQPRTAANRALLAATFLLSELASTDLVPRSLRRDFLEPYVVKAVPCIAVWLRIVISAIPSNRERNSSQT